MLSTGFYFHILHTIYITGSAEINMLCPFVLRATKTLGSFGCSECNRVNQSKLYGVLAVLSAIELTSQNSMEFWLF